METLPETSLEYKQKNSGQKFLKIAELYMSLQGEGSHSGLPCYFIRTAGCDLRCSWCDTPDALSGGQWIDRSHLLEKIPESARLVQITGGEPLLQEKRVIELCHILNDSGKKILLETGGHRTLQNIPDFVHIVMDIKLTGSGESHRDYRSNLEYLKSEDEIKFVIRNEADYSEAKQWIYQEQLSERFNILMSPVAGLMDPGILAENILKDRLSVRLQLQLHKILWGYRATGV